MSAQSKARRKALLEAAAKRRAFEFFASEARRMAKAYAIEGRMDKVEEMLALAAERSQEAA
jgi:hypothetical protein